MSKKKEKAEVAEEGVNGGINGVPQGQGRMPTDKEMAEVLTDIHRFLTGFDRVPGHLTENWSEVKRGVAFVATVLRQRAERTVPSAPGEVTLPPAA